MNADYTLNINNIHYNLNVCSVVYICCLYANKPVIFNVDFIIRYFGKSLCKIPIQTRFAVRQI